MIDFERSNELIAQSTASQLCSFGITVENSPDIVEIVAVTKSRNKKKLDHLLETLNEQRKQVDRFKKKGVEVPTKLMEKIENTEKHIQDLEQLMKS